MSDAFKGRTLKRKNVKGLALSAPQPKSPGPSASDSQIPGGIGNDVDRRDTLEIGVELKLDLRSEDLIVVKELGAGNGGTVSKVYHAATRIVMARKVGKRGTFKETSPCSLYRRSSTSKRRRPSGSRLSGNSTSCTTVTRPILYPSTGPF